MQLCATSEVMGGALKPGIALLMAEDLRGYDFHALSRALARVRAECGMLTLKNILDRIDDGSQHPGANEAWARCLAAEDEANTVIWTAEMEQAWYIALPVLERGDRVGARMAFIQHYERLIGNAVADSRKPEWKISQGSDAENRHQVIKRAVETGQLPVPLAEKYLPPPRGEINPEGKRRIAAKVREMAQALAVDRRNQEKSRRMRLEHDRARRLKQFDEQYEKFLARQSVEENGGRKN